MFWLAAAIGAFGAVIFLFFASDRIQSWAKGEKTKEGKLLNTQETLFFVLKKHENLICGFTGETQEIKVLI